jgi:hypothetical protein
MHFMTFDLRIINQLKNLINREQSTYLYVCIKNLYTL